MSIRFQCPSCGVVHGINEQAVGRRVRCRECNELVSVTPYEPSKGEELPLLDEEDLYPLEELEPLDPEIDVVQPLYATPAPPPVIASRIQPNQPPSAASAPIAASRKPIIFRPERDWSEAEMDMTPMVDVVFQLLIFFMLTASFSMQKSLNVPKPQTSEASSQGRSVQDFQENADYVVVRVDALNTFHVSASAWEDEIEAPSEQELLVKLRQARQGDGRGNVPTKMLVVANGEALHERVVRAIDAGNEVGMDEVQLVTVEEDEG